MPPHKSEDYKITDECDLMEFIQINNIIDENDGAKF